MIKLAEEHRCRFNEFLKSRIPPYFRKDIDEYEEESGELFVDVCDQLNGEICREMSKPLALCCRQHREAENLTTQELAKKMDVDELTIKKVENENFSQINCADKRKVTGYFKLNMRLFPCE